MRGLESNHTLCELVLDGKQDEKITALLERNSGLNLGEEKVIPSDIALIKSVYRTLFSRMLFIYSENREW